LDQFDCTLQQGVAIAAKELPVAVRAVDRDSSKRGAEFDDRLHVDEDFLWLEARIRFAVRAIAKLSFCKSSV